MDTLEHVMARRILDRPHMYLETSEDAAASGSAALIERYESGLAPADFRSLGPTMPPVVAGMLPIVLVEWDLVFPEDVPSGGLDAYMRDYGRRVTSNDYLYRTALASERTLKDFMFEWTGIMQAQGRAIAHLEAGHQSNWLYDCRRGERYVTLHLALRQGPSIIAQA